MSETATEPRYAIRFLDGPFEGETIISKRSQPAERIVAFRSQVVAEGTLLFFDEGEREMLAGDILYERETQSQLPQGHKHRNVIRGGAYRMVEST